MSTTVLHTTVTQIMPTLQALNIDEQKLLIIKELSSDKMPTITESQTIFPTLETDTNLAWETGKNLFGSYAIGRKDLSANAKTLVKK